MKYQDKEESKSNVETFADTIKDNPDEIIKWARREIVEYQELIDILERRNKGIRKKMTLQKCPVCGGKGRVPD